MKQKQHKSQVWSNLICGSAYLDMPRLNTRDKQRHLLSFTSNMPQQSFQVWNMRIRKWDLWASGGHDFHFWMNYFFE